MSGSTFGNMFRVTTWGESHGKGIGVVVDGCPAGLPLCEEDIQKFLNRRKPGQSKYTTPRKEADTVEILSGIFEGKTTGTPISMVVFNQEQRSRDYGDIANCYRPGHADYTYEMKYGIRDYRGGGRSSGRETIGRVAAGAIACKVLARLDIQLLTYTTAIGPVSIDPAVFDETVIAKNALYMPDQKSAEAAQQYLDLCMENRDSCGGMIECIIKNVMPGIGEPAFEKLSANLGKAILSIGAVKGFEIGAGMQVATSTGSQNNDAFTLSDDGQIIKETNHSGGILGGISDGSDIILRAAVKPTPSIAKLQTTVTKDGRCIPIEIKGRHDPIIVPRAVVVVESMAAITVLDMVFSSVNSNMDRLVRFFQN